MSLLNRVLLILQLLTPLLAAASINAVEAQLVKQQKLAANRWSALSDVLGGKLSSEEREALKYLLATLPLSDMADYDGTYFLKNVRLSLRAKRTFPWGKKIPSEIFYQFVLPIRINNEPLDDSRGVFLPELTDRLNGLTMKEAVLELNHWAHEKATYRPSDGRTSCPLSTVRSARGRCGELSTFVVGALRAASIPARQVYVPLWAHTEDNHGWVEVWIDGKWHFLEGAGPAYDLDLAWFNTDVTRAMLVSTTVPGSYSDEETLEKNPRFTRINVLSRYAPTRKIAVTVADASKKAVEGSKVEFQIYNGGSFFPLSSCTTGKNGSCSFVTGLGDLLIWAAKDNQYGYRKATVGENHITVVLQGLDESDHRADLTLVPPKAGIVPERDPAKEGINNERIAADDRKREAYEATFINREQALEVASKLKVDGEKLWAILSKSRGNSSELVKFMIAAPERLRALAFPLLESVSDKDLRDVPSGILLDHLTHSRKPEPKVPKDLFEDYVLSPRIDVEPLQAWRKYFSDKFDTRFVQSARRDPQFLARWVAQNVRLDPEANYTHAPITPIGVDALRVSDAHSRDIYFIALCRSLGIPARLEPGFRWPQYYGAHGWKYPQLGPASPSNDAKAHLTLVHKGSATPQYGMNYSLSRFDRGFYRQLNFEYYPEFKVFPVNLDLPGGRYLLVSGKRNSDGAALTGLSFFSLKAGETKQVELNTSSEVSESGKK